jgi:hypothetical protein
MNGGVVVPGSGATSLGACLSGASRSTCVGSSNEGAMLQVSICVNNREVSSPLSKSRLEINATYVLA